MDETALSVKFLADQERDKHAHFEEVAEKSTYFVIFGALILLLLPFNFPFVRPPLYLLLLSSLFFTFIWFRLIPKGLAGPSKTFLFFVFSLTILSLAVHLTGGIQSFIIFLFYLVVLRASAYINTRGFVILVAFIATLLLADTVIFSNYLEVGRNFNLWLLNIWELIIVAVFGRWVFDEEKKAEDLEESDRLKTARKIDSVKNEFVFLISKKLKEPILVLENYLSTALKNADETWKKDLKDFLGKASENTKHLAKLVNDLSDLSGIENQKLRLEPIPVDLKQIVGSTLSDFNFRADQKKITLTYQPSDNPVVVMSDPSRLHEILANLIDNAIKYSQAGAEVQVSFTSAGDQAQINVSDNGYGIPTDSQTHIFEKFFRDTNKKTTETKGTGLGLFITKELVERQGGKIWFESQDKKGSTFHFTLPLSKEK